MGGISGKDLAYRALASAIGGPVDLATMVMRPFGYSVEKPVLGSEWIGSKLEQGGVISSARDPLKEFAASVMVPGGGIEMAAAKGPALMAGLGGMIKAKGGNWLTGSVEDAVSSLKKREGIIGTPEWAQSDNNVPAGTLNTWIDKQLTKYIKNDMATPGDPVRALAERDVLHTNNLPDVPPKGLERLNARRSDAGFPSGGERTRWEDLTDIFASPLSANEVKLGWYAPEGTGRRDLADNPWLDKVAPDTPIYGRNMRGRNVASDLGFGHLTDELHNALRPDSGLPKNLQLNPVSLNRMGVPQAVEHVAKINKWREEQKVVSNLKIANNPATHLFKEYPTVPGYGGGQVNTRGLKWVELKATGKKELPEGYTVEPNSTYLGKTGYQLRTPDGSRLGLPQETEAAAFAELKNPKYQVDKDLKEALKYEGDTMGHCVGGYCEDVASGRTKIYSLRDAKGRPHVTVEVGPPQGFAGKDTKEEYESWLRNHPTTHTEEEIQQALADLEANGAWLNSVVQIKGKGNKAPKDEYVPFVQDFIHSQKFSDVGDLANAQMYRASNTFNKTELAYLEGHGAKLSGEEYLTKAEVEALQSLLKSN